ncbi:MAG TPA: hypothetical protein DCY24_06800 [Rikenellaceae bacterium]|nr:hypothetical protein [Rikenellaceae bacterium]
MKLTFRIFTALISCFLLFACNGSKEDNTFREEFSVSDGLGIYQDGKPVLTFLKNKHQYYCNPSEGILRIIDNEGTRDVTVKLDGMPSSSGKVSGVVSGNMGIAGFSFSELGILKIDSRTVWLWSDKDKVGFILPAAGLQTTKAN